MTIRKFIILYITTLFIYTIIFSIAVADITHWPVPDWQSVDNSSHMKSKQCQNFKTFSTQSNRFKTESLLVIKDGLVQFEYYDNKNNVNTPHALWSISKTITGAILGTAERDGRINLNQKLYEFYPRDNQENIYNNITILNLLYLDAGFIWNEGEQDVLNNPVIGMLYGVGHENMAKYAASKKMIKEGPSYKWNYSTGTPTITMGVLKKIYGPYNYNVIPWTNLFNPLGIKNAVFEKDHSGTFIGGSGAFATTRDLAKIGYLYLNDGLWNGEIVLSPDWIKKMLTPSPGYISPGTIITNIYDDGVYGGSIWLNKKVKKGLGRPFPYSPEDMYYAKGFMGQLIIMLPTQKMIIVRTGYDLNYDSKIDKFVSLTISCFHDPDYPVGKEIPLAKNATIELGKLIRNVKDSIMANSLQASIAKTMCSCHLVSGMDIPTCIKRNHFTLSKLFTKLEVVKKFELTGEISIKVRLARFARLFKLHFGNSSYAYYDPRHVEYGCTLK